MQYFNAMRHIIKTENNYIPRKYQSIGGMWTTETWRQGDIVFQVSDEGYTQRIIIPFILEVVKTFDNKIIYELGTEDILKDILNKLNKI